MGGAGDPLEIARSALAGDPAWVVGGWLRDAELGRTPAAVQQRLSREVAAVMAEPDMREQLRTQAMEAVSAGPEALRAQIETEIARYRALAHRARIVAE